MSEYCSKESFDLAALGSHGDSEEKSNVHGYHGHLETEAGGSGGRATPELSPARSRPEEVLSHDISIDSRDTESSLRDEDDVSHDKKVKSHYEESESHDLELQSHDLDLQSHDAELTTLSASRLLEEERPNKSDEVVAGVLKEEVSSEEKKAMKRERRAQKKEQARIFRKEKDKMKKQQKKVEKKLQKTAAVKRPNGVDSTEAAPKGSSFGGLSLPEAKDTQFLSHRSPAQPILISL